MNRQFQILFALSLVTFVLATGCAATKNILSSKSRWQFLIAEAEGRISEARGLLGDLAIICKIDETEAKELEAKINRAQTAVYMAQKAWNRWQSHVGVEHGIGASLDDAELLLDEADAIMESYKIRRERECGKPQ